MNKDESMGFRLGDATADDVLFFARKIKNLKKQLLDIKDIVDKVHDLEILGKYSWIFNINYTS